MLQQAAEKAASIAAEGKTGEAVAEFAKRPLADARGSVTCCESTARFRAPTVREGLQASFATASPDLPSDFFSSLLGG
jgi:hypothetical protein